MIGFNLLMCSFRRVPSSRVFGNKGIMYGYERVRKDYLCVEDLCMDDMLVDDLCVDDVGVDDLRMLQGLFLLLGLHHHCSILL